MVNIRTILGASALMTVIATPIAAQDVTISNDLLQSVINCRQQGDGEARLACFERAADSLSEASRLNGIRATSRRDGQDEERTGFGYASRDRSLEKEKLPPLPKSETLDSQVVRVTPSGLGRFVLAFADGSTWQTTESARIDPRVGDPVHVRRGALGSYLASFAKARSLRVQRLR